MESNYEELVSTFVGEEYLEKINTEYKHIAEEYMDRGGSAAIAVSVAWYESSDDITFEEITEELDVSRRGMYNARSDLGLEVLESRGAHTSD